MPQIANQYVTIERTLQVFPYTVTSLSNIPVFIIPTLGDVSFRRYSTEFTYGCRYDLGWVFPDGSPIREGDIIVWSELINGRAIIHRPSKTFGLIESGHFFFNDTE